MFVLVIVEQVTITIINLEFVQFVFHLVLTAITLIYANPVLVGFYIIKLVSTHVPKEQS